MKRDIYLLSPLVHEDVLSLPMIYFTTVAKSLNLERCDTLLFTSKKAVETANEIDISWKELPSIAIGSATKNQIELLGGHVIYQPKHFYAKVLSSDISIFFKEKKILYLRPEKVSFDAKSFLEKSKIELQEQVIYRTSCHKYTSDKEPTENAIIIFTSPSTIHCFLKSFQWKKSYVAIVIGESTKEHLPANAKYKVADTPLIESCVKKAKEIANL